MLSRLSPRRADRGFTLVELLIAMVILGLSVSVLVLAMSSLVVASQEHRGHAVSDTAARDFAEAMQQKWSFVSKITALDNTGATGGVTFTLADPVSGFQSSTPFDIVIDQEVMTVTTASGNTITVKPGDRAAAGSTASGHSVGATISQDFICPRANATDPAAANSAGYLYPDGYVDPKDAANHKLATASIGEVDYWNPVASTFDTSSQSTCLGYFSQGASGCPDNHTFLPECDPGFLRVKVVVPTSLTNLRNVTTTTWVLLRRWSN